MYQVIKTTLYLCILFILFILLPPGGAPASFEHKFVVIQAKLGDSIRLECNATGDQPLSIDWFREGNNATIEKHGNDLYDIHEIVTDFGLSSFMQIRAVKSDDGLLYKCLARNEYGSGERLIKLIVVGVPERPTQLRVRDIWSRSTLVTWMSLYPTNSRVTNYTVQYWRKNPVHSSSVSQQNHRREETIVDGLQSSALLVNLLPALTYEVSVIAHNQVGRSEPSETVNVTTSEEEPSAPPTDVLVEPRGSTSLRVMWKVPPGENLNGKLLGFYIGYRPRFASSSSSLLPAAPHHLSLPLQIQSQALGGGGGQLSQQQQQQQQQQQSVIYSFKTADAIEGQPYYDTFLTNLKHNQDYEVTVRAFNKAGSGPDCHTILARTNSAKLPQSPNLQVQRVTANSVTLRWTSTVLMIERSATRTIVVNSGGSSSPQSLPSQLEILRYILYYQPQGEREWYELTVGSPSRSSSVGAEHMLSDPSLSESTSGITNQLKSPLVNGGEMIGGGGGGANELITSQASVHTLSNLQPGLSYRIYVAAANDYGVGDPSNVVTIKTDSLNSTTSPVAYLAGAALLDLSSSSSSSSSGSPGSLFESWNQQHNGLFYTILSSTALVLMLIILSVYLIWQHRLRRKYNSSSGSSYPSSWTPAASDTIQSEYSVKRFPSSAIAAAAAAANNGAGSGTAMEVYDEVEVVGNQRGGHHRTINHQHQFNSCTSSRALLSSSQQQQQQLLRNMNAAAQSATTSRPPVLSSHYHQPADLISTSGTLQLHPSLSGHNLRHPIKSSATLNRNQNRQLPPIPYSTLAVKEIGGSKQQQWRQQQQPPLSTEYRLCNQQQQQTGNQQVGGGGGGVVQHSSNKHHKQQQYQSTGGSQTPLIYGVIE